MSNTASILYHQEIPENLYVSLQEILRGKQVEVFFRADDIARVDPQFTQMMELFRQYRIPLCLAVVPKWLSRECWQDMAGFGRADALWCWHQHGYFHENHEVIGKKNEFGQSRSRSDVRRDLEAGKKHLETVLGDSFCPVFTPPWNRCSGITLALLAELGFQAVSRSIRVDPEANLPDLCVNVDLHTGKAGSQQEAMERLLADWTLGAEQGRLGIMLHHQRMNSRAFVFLERLLQIVRQQPGIHFSTFREQLKKTTLQNQESGS